MYFNVVHREPEIDWPLRNMTRFKAGYSWSVLVPTLVREKQRLNLSWLWLSWYPFSFSRWQQVSEWSLLIGFVVLSLKCIGCGGFQIKLSLGFLEFVHIHSASADKAGFIHADFHSQGHTCTGRENWNSTDSVDELSPLLCKQTLCNPRRKQQGRMRDRKHLLPPLGCEWADGAWPEEPGLRLGRKLRCLRILSTASFPCSWRALSNGLCKRSVLLLSLNRRAMCHWTSFCGVCTLQVDHRGMSGCSGWRPNVITQRVIFMTKEAINCFNAEPNKMLPLCSVNNSLQLKWIMCCFCCVM